MQLHVRIVPLPPLRSSVKDRIFFAKQLLNRAYRSFSFSEVSYTVIAAPFLLLCLQCCNVECPVDAAAMVSAVMKTLYIDMLPACFAPIEC